MLVRLTSIVAMSAAVAQATSFSAGSAAGQKVLRRALRAKPMPVRRLNDEAADADADAQDYQAAQDYEVAQGGDYDENMAAEDSYEEAQNYEGNQEEEEQEAQNYEGNQEEEEQEAQNYEGNQEEEEQEAQNYEGNQEEEQEAYGQDQEDAQDNQAAYQDEDYQAAQDYAAAQQYDAEAAAEARQKYQEWQTEMNEQMLEQLSSKSIKYIGCSSFMESDAKEWQVQNTWDQATDGQEADEATKEDYYAQQNMDSQDESEEAKKWWSYQRKSRNDGLLTNNMIRFTLCDDNSCDSTCHGEYVIDMEYFLEAYTEWKMEHNYYWCEKTRENCSCNAGDSWYTCYSTCFEKQGLDYDECREAMQESNGENVFDIQQYLTCSGVEFYNPDYAYKNSNYKQSGMNGNEANWRKMYYMGLTCQNYADVMLTSFYDEQCSYRTSKSDMNKMLASMEKTSHKMPYVDGTPIISKGTCISCMDPESDAEKNTYVNKYKNGQYKQYQSAQDEAEDEEQPDATDLCGMVAGADENADAIICDQYNQNGCRYVNYYLPKMDGRNVWTVSVAELKQQLARADRLTWTLASVIVVLVVTIGCFMSRGMSMFSRKTESDMNDSKLERSLMDYKAHSDNGSVSSDEDAPKPPALS